MKHKIQVNGIEVEVEQLPNGKFKKPEIATKYNGMKYSVAPLKQCIEEIMVFQKPYKTGSCLHDVLAFENGDNECTVGALDIDGNRVGIREKTQFVGSKKPKNESNALCYGDYDYKGGQELPDGRFPSQAFVTNETAETLDKQSGVTTSSDAVRKNKETKSNALNHKNAVDSYGFSDTGGASKILHKCNYEDADLFIYEPKVSASERNAGCEFMEKKENNKFAQDKWTLENMSFAKSEPARNSHPTLKPISLNYQITKLFKTPNEQTVLVPFSGAGSELIGLFKAGFENIKGCELNHEYVEIAKARVNHHCTDLFNQNVLDDN